MCGICGKMGPAGVQPDEIRAMLDTIAHRGPDDEGVFISGMVGLGSRRLSIIDLEGGQQPIGNEDGSLWLVFNGEIYNFPELRRQLLARGHRFHTETDSEVILHLYEEQGEACVAQLRGMFAFALWDAAAQKLFLARDRLGQKPLFYSHLGQEFLFASEVKAILTADGGRRQLNEQALSDYLSLRFIPAPATMFGHINKVPPGHTLVYQGNRVRVQPYWELSFCQKHALAEDELLEGLIERLQDAVRSHLLSDVPLGAFLSGGLDSSMVVALMAQIMPERFKSFAIGVEEQDFDELPYARQVAEHVGSKHIEQVVRLDLVRLMPRVIWHLDEPSDPIAACMYHAARLAAQHVKVVLGGDGGDELFAGFDRYLGQRYLRYYARVPAAVRLKLIAPLLSQLPESFAYKSLSQRLRWLQELSQLPDGGRRFAEATLFFRFDHAGKRRLLGADLWRRVEHRRSAAVIADLYENGHAATPLDRMLYADYLTRLPEHSLMLTDRMTMAHGLEARSPMLDHPLVEYMASFPDDLKINGRRLKYALRRVAQEYLPKAIVRRSKQGFMFPIAYWFREQLYPFVARFLQDSRLAREGLLQSAEMVRLLEEHRAGRRDNHVRLWMLLNLEVWYRLYLEGMPQNRLVEQLDSYLAPSRS
ncbi:MAG: asparagine synthase (glutamine-hydrolyzing) [Candidatus Promineifilaceae bacterium]